MESSGAVVPWCCGFRAPRLAPASAGSIRTSPRPIGVAAGTRPAPAPAWAARRSVGQCGCRASRYRVLWVAHRRAVAVPVLSVPAASRAAAAASFVRLLILLPSMLHPVRAGKHTVTARPRAGLSSSLLNRRGAGRRRVGRAAGRRPRVLRRGGLRHERLALGGAIVLRTETYWRLGGQDERFTGSVAEDWAFTAPPPPWLQPGGCPASRWRSTTTSVAPTATRGGGIRWRTSTPPATATRGSCSAWCRTRLAAAPAPPSCWRLGRAASPLRRPARTMSKPTPEVHTVHDGHVQVATAVWGLRP